MIEPEVRGWWVPAIVISILFGLLGAALGYLFDSATKTPTDAEVRCSSLGGHYAPEGDKCYVNGDEK